VHISESVHISILVVLGCMGKLLILVLSLALVVRNFPFN
jgi:hypothetical protein